ncbi:GDSL esterase/lipase At1g23500-like [Glycine soja]|uniref:GDSL esterase/lipase At1g23500-like n=1 Tax=Glycine soja TaxID=3848 RepID=UPI00103EDD0B|nr:GDSL esterase/lipase At1g23500-like [Glycine soja]XP_040867370.1 GDSL esterase/lipase At1g23500 [Glycine max]
MVVFVFFAIPFPKVLVVNGAIPALFAFGDSILDTGNNNNILAITKCNFPPYGRDFPGGIPTGRCCNGKIPTDLIASALGIKETVPAYLSGNLSPQDLVTGVCFASAGSGIDDATSRLQQGVVSLPSQLRLFQEYIGKLTALVGQQRAADIISKSVFLVSAGNNDIAITYSFLLAPTLQPFPLYSTRLVTTTSNFFKSLYELGARRVWVLSTLPLGCLPGGRTVAGGPLRICAPFANQFAQTFNGQLSSAVDSMRVTLPNYDIRFIDVYTPLFNLINNPQPEGFVDVSEGCCGTAPFGVSGICTLLSLCPNPSSYVFWDSAHPTERAYRFVVSSILQQHTNNVSNSFAFAPVNSSLSN